MTKRVYSTPTIHRVELTHEQAVLSMCSVATTNIRHQQTAGCEDKCRQRKDFKGADFEFSS